jgi:hypothetical protein
VFHGVVEFTLRWPLKPAGIRGVVEAVRFQVEFMSGREFCLSVRGDGIVLLNRARELPEALAAVTVSGGETGSPAPPGVQACYVVRRWSQEAIAWFRSALDEAAPISSRP